MELRKLIRSHLDTDAPWEPAEISRRVIADIDDAREALAYCLPFVVREVMAETRRIAPTSKTPQNRSAKVAAIREQEQRRLADARYPDANGIWRRIGSFNHDELLALAERITQNAQRNLARAAAIRSLASELTQAGVTTVDELDNAETLLAGAA